MTKRLDTIHYFDPATGLPATRQVEVDFVEPVIKSDTIKVSGGKPVHIQIGPTPGNAFAVFSKNGAFHEDGREAWDRAAREPLELWAAEGDHMVERIINEHGRPLNLKLEYV